ncbi:MAG: hypothetical protein ABIR46_03960 [Candidatus Saccharimonadales bacterium]
MEDSRGFVNEKRQLRELPFLANYRNLKLDAELFATLESTSFQHEATSL